MRNLILLTLPAALLATGCASRGNVELLEARLRTQEDRLLGLQQELQSRNGELAVARAEIRNLQRSLADRDTPAPLPEQTARLARIEGLKFNPRLTGALDQDARPGDDTLNVLIYPHDRNERPVKLAGAVEIELLDLARPDAERRLGQWTIPVDEADAHWHEGFIGEGFQFTLPWQPSGNSDQLLLYARFTTPDGRKFDARHELDLPLYETADSTTGAAPELPGDLPPTAPASQPIEAIEPIGFEFPEDSPPAVRPISRSASKSADKTTTVIPLDDLPPPDPQQ